MIDLEAYYTKLEVDTLLEKEKTKIENKTIVKNNNSKINVPFDNETIYYENNVWKAKQSGDIPSDVIKDSDLNKDCIDKENGKNIVKKSQDINLKQDKLISSKNIKTINDNSLLGRSDISINTGNDWEVVDTSDFISFSDKKYQIRNYDSKKYKYKLWIGVNENYGDTINTVFETYKNHYEFHLFAGFNGIKLNKNGTISSGNNKLMSLHFERKRIS